jgi:hypothetical protein
MRWEYVEHYDSGVNSVVCVSSHSLQIRGFKYPIRLPLYPTIYSHNPCQVGLISKVADGGDYLQTSGKLRKYCRTVTESRQGVVFQLGGLAWG